MSEMLGIPSPTNQGTQKPPCSTTSENSRQL